MSLFSHLFEPITISSLTLRNRIVMPPMAGNMGIVTERARAYYRERARGGVGLVIVEAAFLHRFESDEFLKGLAELSEPLQKKVQEGRIHEIIECIECNEKCFGNLSKGIPISCTQNERTGFEFEEMGHG